MSILDAIHNAKISDTWVRDEDKGVLECIVEFFSTEYPNATLAHRIGIEHDQTSFDISAYNAEEDLIALWNSMWRELKAVDIDSVANVYIKRSA